MDCVDIKVGFACNNDCVHCVTADKRRFGELTAEQIKDEMSFWRRKIDARDGEQVRTVVVLTGGEPTIRPELPELVAHARGLGFAAVELQTNARALGDASLVKTLAEAGLTSTLVALHGPAADVHDAITQQPGGFDETTAGMRHLIDNGIDVRTNTVISRLNVEHLPRLAPFLGDQFPEMRFGQLTFPHPNGSAETNFDRVVPPMADT
ncbi:MAG: radical SAM protein, partial [Armatimonadota bacterium]